jgi:transposase
MADMRFMVGIDWSEDHLDACIIDAVGSVLGERRFTQDVTGVAALAAWITERACEPSQVGVAIELKRGAVVAALLERGFQVAGINPKQLDRFRDRFTVAGSKDDRRDARALADGLRTDARAFEWLEPEDPLIVQLRETVRTHDDLTQLVLADANRLRDQLLRYYPQAVQLAGDDLTAPWFLEVISKIPTPQSAKKIKTAEVARILTRHRIRKTTAGDVLALLRQPALPVAPGVLEAASGVVVLVAKRVSLAAQQRAENRRMSDSLVAQLEARGAQPGNEGEQRDVEILRSLPGVGRIVLATLLAEGWRPLRRRQHAALRILAGVAPVTKRSGKKLCVTMRRACNPHLREAVHHMARGAVMHYPLWRERFTALHERGISPSHAYRIIGDRLLKVMIAALTSRTTYDEAKLVKAA